MEAEELFKVLDHIKKNGEPVFPLPACLQSDFDREFGQKDFNKGLSEFYARKCGGGKAE